MIQKIIRLIVSKKTPFYIKTILILSLLYILSPVDLVSDFVPVAGWMDDILLGLLWWLYLKGDRVDRKVMHSRKNDKCLDLEEDEYRID